MANLTITTNDLGGLLAGPAAYKDEVLAVGGAVTILAGTILARDSVSLKLVPYVKGGVTNENGIPKAIITYEVTSTGAGDLQIRAAEEAVVFADKLVIDADGDASNVDAAVLDQLRAYNITAVDATELHEYDNQ